MAAERPSEGGKQTLVDWLAEQLAHHSNLYYNEANPEITDIEFDKL